MLSNTALSSTDWNRSAKRRHSSAKWVVVQFETKHGGCGGAPDSAEHWCDCSIWIGSSCDCGGITPARVFAAFCYHHAYNLAYVLRMFRLGVARRAFRLSE